MLKITVKDMNDGRTDCMVEIRKADAETAAHEMLVAVEGIRDAVKDVVPEEIQEAVLTRFGAALLGLDVSDWFDDEEEKASNPSHDEEEDEK